MTFSANKIRMMILKKEVLLHHQFNLKLRIVKLVKVIKVAAIVMIVIIVVKIKNKTKYIKEHKQLAIKKSNQYLMIKIQKVIRKNMNTGNN